MKAETFNVLVGVAQIVIAPLGMLLIGLVMRLYRKIKLIDYKQEALVHAFQHETGNGFSEQYYKKLEELIKQDVFVNTGKKG
jgi:hypothetical protein